MNIPEVEKQRDCFMWSLCSNMSYLDEKMKSIYIVSRSYKVLEKY
jgi:hypothetical protein